MDPRHGLRWAGGAALLLTCAGLVAAGCGGSSSEESDNGLSGTVRIDGSSTVAPLSEAAAERFQAKHPDVRVTVGTSGTGGGFEKFCAGETDISDASRPIEPDESKACEKAGVEYDEFQVANDGLAVVVNPDNDWADCLTTAQLRKIWDAGSTVDNWKDVDPSFPDEELTLFGPGTDSGTFDYFTQAINGEEGRSRTKYNATEDDNVTVQGVSGSTGGIGYFGLSYATQNEDSVKTVGIDSGDGCVTPSTKTVQDGTYTPLSRPLFIYPAKKTLEDEAGLAFVEYYIGNTTDIAEQALFVPLTAEQQDALDVKLDALKGAES